MAMGSSETGLNMERWTPTERALWAVEVLRAGKALTPAAMAEYTGVTPTAARGILARLSTAVPIENDGGLWRWVNSGAGEGTG